MWRAWFGRVVDWATRQPNMGAAGEAAAAAYLTRENGFRVVAKNWRHGRDEIDLVCRDGEVLVFVEVKTRTAGALVDGFAAVDRRKKRALRRVIRAYLGQLRAKPWTFRFDIVAVEHNAGRMAVVRHFANIPLFPKNYHFDR